MTVVKGKLFLATNKRMSGMDEETITRTSPKARGVHKIGQRPNIVKPSRPPDTVWGTVPIQNFTIHSRIISLDHRKELLP